ncbi:MAG: amidohydrolase family protein [Gemmatimonadetes bacterium]|nr:amidohydrolase family protein [Gemmatimonadota bacterium]
MNLPRMAAVLVLSLAVAGGAQAQYDVLIRGARLLDGSGNPWRVASVAITGDRIAAVGLLPEATARRVIDGTGLYVAPGFIDTHSHAGGGLASASLSHGRPLLAQGITTVVVNPDGGGPIDLVAQRARLLEHGLGVNVAQLVPHGSIRREVVGMADRAPTVAELNRMKDLVGRGMEAGGFGLSSGLYYAPGSYSETEEVIALAKVAARYSGVYQSHIRDEADYNVGLVVAVDEVIRIAREAGLPGIVTHIKALGPRVWGFSEALVRRIEGARAAGVSVFADQYPYEASGTSIGGALIPRWAQADGRQALRDRLRDPSERARMREGVLENLDRRGGAGRLQISRHAPDPAIEGKTLQAVAEERSVHPADLTLQLLDAGGATLVSFNMEEADIRTLMRQPWTITASDGGLTEMGRGVPHPRYYGTFPRKIRKYVRDEGVLSLADAVRTMTSLPASVFGMADRGVLREGAFADVVVFDLERVADNATYSDPHQLADGLVYLFVNGRLAIDEGEFEAALHGRVLRRQWKN